MTVPGGRPRARLARARVAAILDAGGESLTHAEVARRARATEYIVREVRRERGEVNPVVMRRPLRLIPPQHLDTLERLYRAHDLGSHARMAAILAGPAGRELRADLEATLVGRRE